MKRAARSRLLMLLGATALVALALWQWRSDARNAPGNLLALDPATVTQVTLQLGDATATHYTKRDGHWWRDDGRRGDDRYLDTLTEAASAPVLEWHAGGDFDAAKIGLSPPRAVLTLDGQRLAFGAVSATGPQCYVQVGQRVALVSLRFMPQAPQQKQQDLGLH
ncbi:hypothetical protein [Rhodanobacter sp. DHB23]|uniref:hypothetical protein n=1 Tax=Rhodanobacter sp. DHB23 TaxID=2775923 RepID=UPI001782CCE2|nr:hypothetical protein [Rhodanobacter sp. DHB23]MBD8874334.1 hypothetical protein [Rhodanobacter sp. DHB23]